MKFTHLCFAGLLIVAPLVSRALVFSPDAVSTNMGANGGTTIGNTILVGDLTLNGLNQEVHAISEPGNAWIGSIPSSPAVGTVTFSFNQMYSLTGLNLWNLTGDIASAGLKTVNIAFSTDGDTYNGSFSQMFAAGASTAENISFISAVNATHVRFEILSSQSAPSLAGFNQIKFTGERVTGTPSVPDGGSTLAILGATLLGLVGLRRRLNRG
jgi:hypothetical protein